MALLEIKDLNTWFFTQRGTVKAVNGVSLSVNAGEIVAIVGESGSGKSVTNFSIMGLVQYPGKIVSGSIKFKDNELTSLSGKQMREYRGKKISMIFQDPLMTLNPVYKVKTQMAEALAAHGVTDKKQQYERSIEVLKMVGIPSPHERMEVFPHELSGGMRQRIVIAIGLLNEPELLLADEPTTALDVTIQSQILYETKKLVEQLNMGLIWVSHDLATVANLADKIAVMYAGRIVEIAPTKELIENCKHPYTKGLLTSAPSYAVKGQALHQIQGETPNLLNLAKGCSFADRCDYAKEECRACDFVETYDISDEHKVNCILYKEGRL